MNDVFSDHFQSKASNVLGGKTARACDSCLVKRARWFCPGDDAFLCQACDTSVHSASVLASRHERVRLETSSRALDPGSPAWLTRKARTPRQAKACLGVLANHLVPEISAEDPFVEENEEEEKACLGVLANHLVPEISSEDPFVEENEEEEEQFFCRVPVFDAFAEELIKGGGSMMMLEHDLNVEEMLSDNVDEFSYVKVEEKDDEEVKDVIACHFDPSLDLELNWDFDSMINNKEEEEEMMKMEMENESKMLLSLNYEEVIEAWDAQGSPWTDGIRPQFDLDEFMVACLGEISVECGGGGGRLSGANFAGREARVSRYREKRRTRLFSKKIRYEVRKLNAEKRPRMKGRFVKRSTFQGSSLPYDQLINK